MEFPGMDQYYKYDKDKYPDFSNNLLPVDIPVHLRNCLLSFLEMNCSQNY